MESRQNPFDIEQGDIKISYDVGHELAEYLDLYDLVNTSKVSFAWSRFFSEDLLWKRQLRRDFGITTDMLECLCKHKNQEDITAKAAYVWMQQITSCPYRMPNYAKKLVKRSLHGELLVAIATDDSDKLLSLITPEEQPQWYEVALYAGCKNIPFRFYIEQDQGVIRADYFAKAILAGHENMYEFITKRDRASLAPTLSHCTPAIRSGNANILKEVKLIYPNGFTQSTSELHAAICSGSLEQVKLITSDEFGVEIDNADDKALELACEVGAVDIVEHLLTKGIKPRQTILTNALAGGRKMLAYWLGKREVLDADLITNLAMAGASKTLKRKLSNTKDHIQLQKSVLIGTASSGEHECLHLLLTSNKLKLCKPDNKVLNEAASSGSVATVNYLLQNYDLTANIKTLNNAASSGNLALVKLLMDKHRLTPDLNTLREAILSESFALTNFLLHPQNEFYRLTWDDVLVICQAREGTLCGNTSLATCLLQAHRFVRHAINDLENDGDHIDIESFLENAQMMAPTHFIAMMHHIVSKPERYNLTEENIEWLRELDVVENALAPQDENQLKLGLSVGF